MKRLRLQARKLSLLALFALALQLGLSFGHTHASFFTPVGAQAAIAATHAPDADHDHDHGAAGHICDICTTVALARSLLGAAPPVLPIPTSFTAARHIIIAQSDAPDSQRAAFQSRAPPSI
jgi:hypothetical protein